MTHVPRHRWEEERRIYSMYVVGDGQSDMPLVGMGKEKRISAMYTIEDAQ